MGALEEIECDVAFCCGLGGDGGDACYHCKQKLELINMLHAQCGWAFDAGRETLTYEQGLNDGHPDHREA